MAPSTVYGAATAGYFGTVEDHYTIAPEPVTDLHRNPRLGSSSGTPSRSKACP